jgi:DNA-directed RNA polymerase subunit RPC12/RpoP
MEDKKMHKIKLIKDDYVCEICKGTAKSSEQLEKKECKDCSLLSIVINDAIKAIDRMK